MVGRLSGSVPATKESPLATSKAMAVLKNVVKMGRNIPPKNGMKLEWNGMRLEWNGMRLAMNGIKLGPQPVLSHPSQRIQ